MGKAIGGGNGGVELPFGDRQPGKSFFKEREEGALSVFWRLIPPCFAGAGGDLKHGFSSTTPAAKIPLVVALVSQVA